MMALLEESAGKPEVQYGDTVVEAVPPEWKTVKKMALSVAARTRDLRVAIILLRSVMAMHGMEGAADGLVLVKRMLEERWDFVHPQLDPDDDNDPTMRINCLASLADGPSFVREFKEVAFITLPGLGPFNVRQLEYSTGEATPREGQQKHELSTLHASMADIPAEQMKLTMERCQAAFDAIKGIEAALSSHVGASNMLNLDSIIRPVKKARDFVAAQMAGEEVALADGAAGESAAAGPASGGGTGRAVAISGEIASRDDVSRMIDKICTYYSKYEPSSPVPILLQRAKRLVPKTFLEIMEDLTPDGLGQLQVFSGAPPQNDEY
jgi:type VI secretion system protein ImpA